MDQKDKTGADPSVERITFNGVEMLLVSANSDVNETQVERIFAAFATIDRGENPPVIISTTAS